jgi:hypothetical protein
MKNTGTTAVSGCLIWFILISIVGTCVMPVFFVAASLSSFSEFAVQTTGGWLCPEGTTPQRHTYATTSTDEYGNSHPAIGYSLHCVDASGEVIKEDLVLYAFIWIGVLSLVGMIVCAVICFIFAVPGGMLVTKLLEKLKSPKARANIST